MIEYARSAARQHPGDLVEIGMGYGEHTRPLLEIARHHGRRLIGIDPFDDQMPPSYRYSFEKFKENIAGLEGFLHLHRRTSLCESSEEVCKVPLCFAFIDGLQYKGAVLSDLRIVSHAKVICVDDYDRCSGESQVPSAIKDFLQISGKKLEDAGRWAILT